jgi:hypothetical protein
MVASADMRAAVVIGLSWLAAQSAGAQTIHFTPPSEIARDAGPRRFSEPHLAVHPARPTHLLASAFIASNAGSPEEMIAAQRCAAFVTLDGGRTWARHEFAITQCYDEQVAIAPDGQAVFVALGHLPGLKPDRLDWLVAFHSSDGGVTWDDEPADARVALRSSGADRRSIRIRPAGLVLSHRAPGMGRRHRAAKIGGRGLPLSRRRPNL